MIKNFDLTLAIIILMGDIVEIRLKIMIKAIQYLAFGNSSVIEMKNIQKPQPKEGEVLIQIATISVNPVDMKIREGSLQKTRPIVLPFIPGLDAAGIVVQVGAGVKRLKIGDRVVANAYSGSYTEYACFAENHVSVVPSTLALKEATALSIGLVTGYTFLVERGQVKEGDRVLILGASGGTGSIVLQMAKYFGTYVIGTASGHGLAQAKSMGADQVIDYNTQDYTQFIEDVDLVIDFVGGSPQANAFKSIKPGGKLLSAFSPPSQDLAKKHNVTAEFLIASLSHHNLDIGLEMAAKGAIKPSISKVMSLEDAALAQDLLTKGGLNGKIILEVIRNCN
jgi:NADPH:quinone reductase-like Zn-dependent oxidoreductase